MKSEHGASQASVPSLNRSPASERQDLRESKMSTFLPKRLGMGKKVQRIKL